MDIGQMFMVGFDGCTVDDSHPVCRTIAGSGLGGVILFDRNVDGAVQNIRDPEQLRELTRALQACARDRLLIGVDQEGGRVCRLKPDAGFPAMTGARELGGLTPAETGRQAARMAASLAECGINLNLAPVVDLDLNPDNPVISRFGRSFGPDPDQVARHARTFVLAHHEHGVGCCLKHFPGHGSAGADSHLGFVDSTDRWQARELEPFRVLIREGLADAVMTAHVVQRRLDPGGLPATLSARIIGDLLRRQLGFAGVVISDDLQMRAITDRWGFAEAVAMAVQAGVDLMIVGNNLVRQAGVVEEGIRAVAALLADGRVRAERVEASIGRIRALKRKIAGELPWKNNVPTA